MDKHGPRILNVCPYLSMPIYVVHTVHGYRLKYENAMENSCLLLLHWEALYPFENINNALVNLKLPEGFPKASIHIALPSDYLHQASNLISSNDFTFGANDMLDVLPAAFTKSIVPKFLQEAKAQFVLIGHAFKRNQLKESTSSINGKIRAALEANIHPFFCFGETPEEFEQGHTAEIIKKQLTESLTSLSPEEIQRVFFVYDTPTALTTLSTITQKNIKDTHVICQQQYIALWGEDLANRLKTLCALDSYYPIAKEFLEDSPFAGFYFKMVDANLSAFSKSAATVASFVKALPSKAQAEQKGIETNSKSDLKQNDHAELTPGVPVVAPTQTLAVHEDFPLQTNPPASPPTQ